MSDQTKETYNSGVPELERGIGQFVMSFSKLDHGLTTLISSVKNVTHIEMIKVLSGIGLERKRDLAKRAIRYYLEGEQEEEAIDICGKIKELATFRNEILHWAFVLTPGGYKKANLKENEYGEIPSEWRDLDPDELREKSLEAERLHTQLMYLIPKIDESWKE